MTVKLKTARKPRKAKEETDPSDWRNYKYQRVRASVPGFSPCGKAWGSQELKEAFQ